MERVFIFQGRRWPAYDFFRGVVRIEWTKKRDVLTSNAGKLSLTVHEQKLIEILRDLNFGEMRIVVKDGTPVHVEEIKKSIKL